MRSLRPFVSLLALGLFFTLGACGEKAAGTNAVPKATTALATGPVAALDTFWIDVRTPSEFAEGHLPEAYNIPLQEFDSRFAAELPNKNAVVALYCRSGNRSGQALSKAQALGYTRAFNAGGFAALNQTRAK